MSNVYRKGRYWHTWGHHEDGRRWWASTKVSVDQPERVARIAAKKIERDKVVGPRTAPRLTIVEALELLRAHKERKGVSASTMEITRDKGRQLIAHFGVGFDVAAVTLADCEGYMDARRPDVTDHTIAKELATLRAALVQARRHGRYIGEPRDLWPSELVDFYTPRDRWLTVNEYRRLRMAAYPPRREHLAAYVYLGVRYSELYRIRSEHLDLAGRRVFVDGTKTKASKRWVPIARELVPVLERRADRGQLFEPWLRQNMRQSLHRWATKAQIAPLSANDLRRTFASWLCSAGVPELTAARLMGHTSSTMVRRVYAQLGDEVLLEAIDRLPLVTVDGATDMPRDSVETGD